MAARQLRLRNKELKLRWSVLAKQLIAQAIIFFDDEKSGKKCVVQPVRLKIKFRKSGTKKINLADELPGLTMP